MVGKKKKTGDGGKEVGLEEAARRIGPHGLLRPSFPWEVLLCDSIVNVVIATALALLN